MSVPDEAQKAAQQAQAFGQKLVAAEQAAADFNRTKPRTASFIAGAVVVLIAVVALWLKFH
jgi:hypothetical protein